MIGEQYLKSAFSYLFIGDYIHATAAFGQAIAADPENPVFAFHGSITALRNGDLELAERWAICALANDPEHPMYLQHLNRVRSQKDLDSADKALFAGDSETAQILLEQAVYRDPFNERALCLLNRQTQAIDEVKPI